MPQLDPVHRAPRPLSSSPRAPWPLAVALCAVALSACGGRTPAGGGAAWTLPDVSGPPDSAAPPPDAATGLDAAGGDAGPLPSDAAETDAAAGPEDAGPLGPACTKHAVCQKSYPETPYCDLAKKVCVPCLIDTHCKVQGQTCQNHKCQKVSCVPGVTACQDGFIATCRPTGDGYELAECPAATPVCVGDKCRKCVPGQTYCAPPATPGGVSKQLMKCDNDGTAAVVLKVCHGEQACINGSCGACQPGQKRCSGQLAQVCAADGEAWQLVEDCGSKALSCLGGLCVNPCSGDFKSNTNVGCDYWAVDLDNALEKNSQGTFDAQNAQFSVIVSNTADAPAKVHVTLGPDKLAPGAKTATYTVPAKGLQVIDLPAKGWKLGPQNQEGSSINTRVYRIQSEQPIVAYQFNPLQNSGVFSNDASLLLPSNALGKEYWVVSRDQLGKKYRSYFTIIATTPGTTKVKVVSSAPTLAGPSVPAMAQGTVKEFSLTHGQVLNIESNKESADLTGSWIRSDQPVAVFGGSEASNSPSVGNCVSSPGSYGKVCASTGISLLPKKCGSDAQCTSECCADHLEEQLFPVETWGTQYVCARLYPRGKEKDAWRIVAAHNGTKVIIKPNIGVTLPKGGLLNGGEHVEFETLKDFVVESNKPVLVAQYMASSFATVTTNPGKTSCLSDAQCKAKYGYDARCKGTFTKYCHPIGDPSLILNVATTQYLDDYIFLVPDKYKQNYITIVAEQSGAIELDKKTLPGGAFQQVPGSKWLVARLPILPGAHHLIASKPVGLFVYGYDSDVSYGYAGGAGLSAKP